MLKKLSVAFLFVFVVTYHLYSAPVPIYKPKKPPPFTFAGKWRVDWGQAYFIYTFAKNNNSDCSIWKGSWAADGKKVICIHEHGGDNSWYYWYVILDDSLSGVVVSSYPGYNGIRVKFTREE